MEPPAWLGSALLVTEPTDSRGTLPTFIETPRSDFSSSVGVLVTCAAPRGSVPGLGFLCLPIHSVLVTEPCPGRPA